MEQPDFDHLRSSRANSEPLNASPCMSFTPAPIPPLMQGSFTPQSTRLSTSPSTSTPTSPPTSPPTTPHSDPSRSKKIWTTGTVIAQFGKSCNEKVNLSSTLRKKSHVNVKNCFTVAIFDDDIIRLVIAEDDLAERACQLIFPQSHRFSKQFPWIDVLKYQQQNMNDDLGGLFPLSDHLQSFLPTELRRLARPEMSKKLQSSKKLRYYRDVLCLFHRCSSEYLAQLILIGDPDFHLPIPAMIHRINLDDDKLDIQITTVYKSNHNLFEKVYIISEGAKLSRSGVFFRHTARYFNNVCKQIQLPAELKVEGLTANEVDLYYCHDE